MYSLEYLETQKLIWVKRSMETGNCLGWSKFLPGNFRANYTWKHNFASVPEGGDGECEPSRETQKSLRTSRTQRRGKMAPKRKKKEGAPPSDPDGIFAGLVVFLVESGVQPRRLQVSVSPPPPPPSSAGHENLHLLM